MTGYEIEWDVHKFFEGLQNGFDEMALWYMIFLKGKGLSRFKKPEMIYIGSAYKQTVSERLLNRHEALQSAIREMDGEIMIGLGYWVGGGIRKNQKGITEGAVRSIESVIIAEFKPRLNGIGVKKYKGTKIKVVSSYLDDENWEDLNWIIEY
jgi:hypothetical protein